MDVEAKFMHQEQVVEIENQIFNSKSDGVCVKMEVSPTSSFEMSSDDSASPTSTSVTNYQSSSNNVSPTSSFEMNYHVHYHEDFPSSSFETDTELFEEMIAGQGSTPIIVREGSDESVSLLGRHNCSQCKENTANTCVMHHSERHMDLCYWCAVASVTAGNNCPLCGERILYIYLYDDV